MSQVYLGVSGTPSVSTSFATDSGTATPAANIITILGVDSTDNNDNGIQTVGSGSTVSVQLTNRYTAALTTADATITTIVTLPMTATPGTFYVHGNVQLFESATPASAGFSFSGAYRTDGATSVELGTEFHDTFQDPSLAASDIFLSVSGNNILLQVKGIAATSINWNSLMEYRIVG